MLVTWNDDYSLGFKAVDDGHALVIDAINRLNRAASRAHRDGEVSGLLPVLELRLGEYFDAEESLLRLMQAPNLAGHQEEHRQILSVLEHIRILFRQGEDVASALMLNLVCHLVSHLRGTDQDDFAGPCQAEDRFQRQAA